jgi:two-component system response regulator CpxR
MSIVTICSGAFCHREEVASHLAKELECRLVTDADVIQWAVDKHGADKDDLEKAAIPRRSLFGGWTQENPAEVALLRQAVAEVGSEDNLIHDGRLGHLIPGSIAHVLKVCLVASEDYRLKLATESEDLAERAARKQIRQQDLELAEWTNRLFEKGPWDKSLYDLKLPMHTHGIAPAVAMIADHARSNVIQTTDDSRRAWADFLLAARVGTALTKAGHNVKVTALSGDLTIEVNKYVVRFDALSKRLGEAARKIDGVQSVKVVQGPKFRAGYLADGKEFSLPAKVLLVDDEQEYVQTLSERLQMRDIGTATVYSGEGALEAIEEEEPEVIVLDLRMPGIDGMEVLRRVKRTRPHVEVIILTGHGSEGDRALAEELGAVAYLEKPVSIERLTETLQHAYEKIRRERRGTEPTEE